VEPSAWERDKALQLFQFLLIQRRRMVEREQIVEQLWPQAEPEAAERDFKVALNAALKALEPDRPPRAEGRFIRRQGRLYGLDMDLVWTDAGAMEAAIGRANARLAAEPEAAIGLLREAAELYAGDFLPERRYEDWALAETERLQTLALGAMTRLAALLVSRNPLESLHLTQRVLEIDPVWEEAWRIQMEAHLASGNRPLALRSWERCLKVMRREIGLDPLPATRAVHARILAA
jgi:two-component SAPR family response regulator